MTIQKDGDFITFDVCSMSESANVNLYYHIYKSKGFNERYYILFLGAVSFTVSKK